MVSGTDYHEAAHAVAHVVLGYALFEVSGASDIKDKLGHTHGEVLTDALKKTTNWTVDNIGERDRQVARDDTVILLVGELAECRHEDMAYRFDPNEPPASSDRQEILGRIGRMEPGNCDAQNALLEELIRVASDLVDDNWQGIVRVAEALADSVVIDEPALRQLLAESPPHMT